MLNHRAETRFARVERACQLDILLTEPRKQESDLAIAKGVVNRHHTSGIDGFQRVNSIGTVPADQESPVVK